MHVCTHPVDLKWQLLIKKNFQQEVLALKTDSEDSEEEEDELDDEEVDDEIEGDEEEDSDNDVVDSSSSEEEDEGEEGEEVLEGVPREKAWGKSRNTFYGAAKFDGLQGFDRDEAQDEEEREGVKIQKRIMAEYADMELDIDEEKDEAADGEEKQGGRKLMNVTEIPIDWSALTEEEQWEQILKESPEIPGLRNGIMPYYKQAQALQPFLSMKKNMKRRQGWFIQWRYDLCMKYVMLSINYLTYKVSGRRIPKVVFTRLVEVKKLLNESDSAHDKFWKWSKRHMEEIMEEEVIETTQPVKRANTHILFDENNKKRRKQTSLQDKLDTTEVDDELDGEDSEDEAERVRRAVNREISKAAGYKKSKKSKMAQNPRVKHREKFRRAKVLRKGGTKTYKPLQGNYTGEASGIRDTVIHSRRLK